MKPVVTYEKVNLHDEAVNMLEHYYDNEIKSKAKELSDFFISRNYPENELDAFLTLENIGFNNYHKECITPYYEFIITVCWKKYPELKKSEIIVKHNSFQPELDKTKFYNDFIVKAIEKLNTELPKIKIETEKEKIEDTKKEKKNKNLINNKNIRILKSWAKEFGSELLKLRIKHDQEWVELAIHEHVSTIYPGFELYEYSNFCDEKGDIIRKATLSQLKKLDEFIENIKGKTINDKISNIVLVDYDYNITIEFNYNFNDYSYTFVRKL